FIEKYKDKWDWGGLSRNRSLTWSKDFIEKYNDKWDWGDNQSYGLSRNESLPWSEAFIEKYKDKWDWGHDDHYGLSFNGSLPWTEAFIEKYKDKWDWGGLSRNRSLPWSKAFIEKYKDKWYWGESGLSNNRALPWSKAFIEKYKDKWGWMDDDHYGLYINGSLPWDETLIEMFIPYEIYPEFNPYEYPEDNITKVHELTKKLSPSQVQYILLHELKDSSKKKQVRVLIGTGDSLMDKGFSDVIELVNKNKYDLKFILSYDYSEILDLIDKESVDIFILLMNNIGPFDLGVDSRLENSLQLIDKIKLEHRKPVIALLAWMENASVIERAKISADHFFFCPPNVEAFMDAFEKCLDMLPGFDKMQ
nr:hypothetical protein [Desulfobacula sp.]